MPGLISTSSSESSPPTTPGVHAEAVHIPGEYTKLILCFDGTGNTFSGTNADTNVVKILRKLDRNHEKQYHYYQTGIGTYDVNETSAQKTKLGEIRSSISKSIDQGFGTTFDAHIMAGYRFLMRYYEPDARIYIFGFSRGAYTAKFLARMINKVGLLCKGNEEMVPFAYSLYQRALKCDSDDRMAAEKKKKKDKSKSNASRDSAPNDTEHPDENTPFIVSTATNGTNGSNTTNGESATNGAKEPETPVNTIISGDVVESDATKAAKKEVEAFSETFCRTAGGTSAKHANIKVFFLGMWDCVNSVAVTEANAPAPVEVRGTATYIRHAVAADERRVKFKPALLAQDIRQQVQEDDILEMWFPGNHGDIGGGWPAMAAKSPDKMSPMESLKYIFSTMKPSNLKTPLEDDALQMSDMALDWMIREVELVGSEHPKSQVRWCHNKDLFKANMNTKPPPNTPNTKSKVQEFVIEGFMHDTLRFGYGSSFFKVLMWKFMELLPFVPRWELNDDDKDGNQGWVQYRKWPNLFAPRDIPRESLLHNSLKERLNAEELNYRPKNNHGGSSKPCLLSDNGKGAEMVTWGTPNHSLGVEWAERHQAWQLTADLAKPQLNKKTK
ncbi:uncharacterized protein FIESC28_01835 [Fusarium coffeatum]|uniref:T6SS Phospholipase effector Tle1-like catalytic domain-containing protein n=1 Tax=Fusarium coffeatum TaxID=231269 RepID=A0A366S908_9HYPO|nr:uncharacterized protein FIESC28_01835 [Fusarium coffeatum]RBR25398.1 hypothetical protein FIESC28_01835 [Fusarium coffeatum]